jgi:hypothetical protein
MWILKQTLSRIGKHLPDGYRITDGTRSLFPPGTQQSISTLSNYVYMSVWNGDAGTDLADADQLVALVGSDGAGRWFYAWLAAEAGSLGEFDINLRSQAGFVFYYSRDGLGRGYVDTSRPIATSYNCGLDPWLIANWPQAFPKGVYNLFQYADGTVSLPSESQIWTNVGFGASQFIALQGSQCNWPTINPEPPFSNFGPLPDPMDFISGLQSWWT